MVLSELLGRSLCILFEKNIYEYETRLGNGIKRAVGEFIVYLIWENIYEYETSLGNGI